MVFEPRIDIPGRWALFGMLGQLKTAVEAVKDKNKISTKEVVLNDTLFMNSHSIKLKNNKFYYFFNIFIKFSFKFIIYDFVLVDVFCKIYFFK